jgi:hypothetical protein
MTAAVVVRLAGVMRHWPYEWPDCRAMRQGSGERDTLLVTLFAQSRKADKPRGVSRLNRRDGRNWEPRQVDGEDASSLG